VPSPSRSSASTSLLVSLILYSASFDTELSAYLPARLTEAFFRAQAGGGNNFNSGPTFLALARCSMLAASQAQSAHCANSTLATKGIDHFSWF
jgi:hypothetical protein